MFSGDILRQQLSDEILLLNRYPKCSQLIFGSLKYEVHIYSAVQSRIIPLFLSSAADLPIIIDFTTLFRRCSRELVGNKLAEKMNKDHYFELNLMDIRLVSPHQALIDNYCNWSSNCDNYNKMIGEWRCCIAKLIRSL